MSDTEMRKYNKDESKILKSLATAIESEDEAKADSLIGNLASLRKDEIEQSLNIKAHILQQNIKEFLSGNNFLGLTEEELPDAMDRLKHVIEMTDKAAHSTIDSTEHMRDNLDDIRSLIREAKLSGIQDQDAFLSNLTDQIKTSGSSLNDILLAQSYQDLSGQMIKKVLMLIEDVQDNVIDLIVMIGDIKPNIEASRIAPTDRLPLAGPSIPGDFNVVGNQDDVDDLFDSLA